MKKCLVLAFLLLWCWSAGAQNPAGTFFRVDKQLTVWLPAQPQELDVPQTAARGNLAHQEDPMLPKSRAFRLDQQQALYIIVCIPLSEPPTLPAGPAEREAYYANRAIPLLLEQAHGQLLEHSLTKKDSIDVLTLKFQAPGRSGAQTVKYLRMATIGLMMYQLYYIPKDARGKDGEAERLKFFDFGA